MNLAKIFKNLSNEISKISNSNELSKNEITGTIPIEFTKYKNIKPFFSVNSINSNIYKVGNILIASNIVDFIVKKELEEDILDFYIKLGKISESIWNFEQSKGLYHNYYVISAYSDLYHFRIESADISNDYNRISTNNKVVASIIADQIDISYITRK